MILNYMGANSSILLVTAMSVDRFITVVYPHFYLRKVQPQKLVFCNAIICVFSSSFALLQLTGISMDVYHTMDCHLQTTFTLVTTVLPYFGIFFFLKKGSRVDVQRQTISTRNPPLYDLRYLGIAQSERKFVTTSFCILLFLIILIIPYFLVCSLEAKCRNCRNQVLMRNVNNIPHQRTNKNSLRKSY